MVVPGEHERLIAVLERARRLGFLGPGPVEPQVEHALEYARWLPLSAERIADLGSGGGLPALPLALHRPGMVWWLVEASERRADVLRLAVRELGLAERVVVLGQPAQEVGRGALRGSMDVVVARSLGPPAVTAELGAPLLRPGGVLVVSDRLDADRWRDDAVAPFGLEVEPAAPGWQVLRQRSLCPGRFPRRRPGRPVR